MDIVILLPLVLDLFLPWIMKLLSSFYSFFNLELFKILFLWIMHHLLSLIWNLFIFLGKWNHSSSLVVVCVF
jgi:hypothetical protein